MGTIDSWMLWNMTGGTDGVQHLTDVSNAPKELAPARDSERVVDLAIDGMTCASCVATVEKARGSVAYKAALAVARTDQDRRDRTRGRDSGGGNGRAHPGVVVRAGPDPGCDRRRADRLGGLQVPALADAAFIRRPARRGGGAA